MTDKEKIIAYIDKLLEKYPNNYYLLIVAEFIDDLQEEPKKCMYALDDFNDEDRKVTCDGCEEDCKYAKLNTMLDDALTNETKESWNERLDKKDYRERYKRIAQSESFRKTYEGISIGDTVPVEGEISEEPTIPDIVDEHFYEMLGEEPVSEEIEKVAKYYIPDESYHMIIESEGEGSGENVYDYVQMINMFKAGAKWQKENLWKPADGDDLPEIDREVIALEGIVDPTATDCLCGYKVIFAHRPATEGYDGKSITTGETEHYTPKTYGEGGWNIPNIVYWLDVELPKETEL